MRVTVRAVNEPPTLAAPGNQRFDELTTLRLSLSGSDPDDNDQLTFILASGNQPGMNLSATGEFEWTMTESQDGSYSVEFQVRDRDGLVSPIQLITIQVADVNLPPALGSVADSSAAELSLLELTLSATDLDQVNGTPDSVTFAIQSGNQPGMTLGSSTGLFRWTPTESQDGLFVVVFVADDGMTESPPRSLTITVTESNEPPVLANPGNRSLDERTEIVLALSAADSDVIAGVTDQLGYAIVGQSLPGMTLDSSTGEFRWTPTELQDGAVSVVFQATDSRNATSAPQTVAFTVRELNEAPALTVPPDVVPEEEALVTFTLLAADGDVAAGVPDRVTFAMLSPELPGMSLDRQTGEFRWLPSEAQDGAHAVVFQATDSHNQVSSLRTLTVTVTEKNEPPVLDDSGDQSVAESASLAFQLTATDPDTVNGVADTVEYELVSGQLPGMTLARDTGAFAWTPIATQAGSHVVVFQAKDQHGLNSNQQSVTITVGESNRPPKLQLSSQAAMENLSGLVIGTLSIDEQDPDQQHTFTVMDSRFEIVGNELRLKTDQALDLAAGGEVVVEVIAKDNGVPEQTLNFSFVLTVMENSRPWQNRALPNDATHDGQVVPLDALNVINQLNEPTLLDTTGKLPRTRPANSRLPYYDVNGDGFCSTNDALRIINAFNNSQGEGESSGGFSAWILPTVVAMATRGDESLVSTANIPRAEHPASQHQPAQDPVIAVADRLAELSRPDDDSHRQGDDLESLIDYLAADIARNRSRPVDIDENL